MKVTSIIVLAIAAAMSSLASAANASDSLRMCMEQLQATNAKVLSIQNDNVALSAEIVNLTTALASKGVEIDSLNAALRETNVNVAALADSLDKNVSNTQAQLKTSSDTINQRITQKSQLGLWVFLVLSLAVAVIAFVFGRKLTKRGYEVDSLAAKADKLNEEIVNRLSSEMSELQTLSKHLATLSTASGGNIESEHKLIATLADRITFMEMTLAKMDSSVRGYKQLSRSITQMKDNLLANGYELVDMLGKEYHEGMKAIPTFVEDENLPAGAQVITGIIKPQINFNGKIIQTAQITVSQNI